MIENIDPKTAEQVARQIVQYFGGHKIDRRGMSYEAKRLLNQLIAYDFCLLELPPAILKVFFDRFVAKCGWNTQAICRSLMWLQLNVYPVGHRCNTPADTNDIERFFLILDHAGYIHFQSAGDIWTIDPKTNSALEAAGMLYRGSQALLSCQWDQVLAYRELARKDPAFKPYHMAACAAYSVMVTEFEPYSNEYLRLSR